ncbi:hypothetical protein DUNSADRAFT_15193 [Dunaliella salina]|uniref:LAGLIDADG homing endonuclease n=1 Tax=Dunaliella salina TaxID=3046 RepID=A0ABQ7G5V2_DUNSA|nr:hypothetical protein DUNSADRAFT_15193 [Dunaliella salina]|eukprot:KAF5829999.1 hypothetical protein DUNSADRAFT_15193 [Dunaliella salina]
MKRQAHREKVTHDSSRESTVTLLHGQYTRAFCQKKQRRQEQEWQSEPRVRTALDALSRQGGSRTSGTGFRHYLAEEAKHFDVLVEEFVVSKKRAYAAMLRYRGKRKAWDSFTSRLLRKLCEVGSC